MSGDSLNTVAILVSSSGAISISKITIEKESDCICCPKVVTMNEPVETELAVDSDSPLSAFSYNDTLLLAYRVSPLKINTFVLTTDGIIKNRDSITVNQSTTGQTITTLNFAFKNGIWIGGSEGLIRYIPLSNGRWSDQTIYDLSQPETVIVLDGTFAATTRGNTYLYVNAKFQLQKAFPFAINSGNDNWLSGENKLVYKIDSKWEYCDIVSEAVHAHVFYSDSGPIVEWIDKNWNYGSAKAKDYVTDMTIIKPDTIDKYINYDTLNYNYKSRQPLNFTVLLFNPTKYMQLPFLKPLSYFPNTSLYNVTGYQFSGKSQNPTCIPGKANLISDTIKYTITPDSIYWESEFLLGTIDFTCGSCKQVRKHIRLGNSIVKYQGISLSTGTDSLIIITGPKQVTKVTNPEKNNRPSSIHALNNMLLFKPGNNLSGGTIKVYSLTGKCISSKLFSKDLNSVEIPLIYASQSVIVRVIFNNGVRMEQIVPVFRN
ncbi:MAG: hypothetical protein GX640_19600 [Fibrobacter sp.]|nr:hypothetical protein [Fibrobacter sp.]